MKIYYTAAMQAEGGPPHESCCPSWDGPPLLLPQTVESAEISALVVALRDNEWYIIDAQDNYVLAKAEFNCYYQAAGYVIEYLAKTHNALCQEVRPNQSGTQDNVNPFMGDTHDYP